MIQQVLQLPELKVSKPSDARWLAHEKCVRAVRMSYEAIVTCLNSIYEDSHDPVALGLCKTLSKQSTIAAVYMLDHVLPQVAKLSRTLQTEHLDLSVVEATLHTLNDTELPSANWVLDLLDGTSKLEEATGIKVTMPSIVSFQKTVAKPFVAQLKENISCRFSSSSEIVSAFSIFDPRKVSKVKDTPAMNQYGEQAIATLLSHYGVTRPAETLTGELANREAMVTSDVVMEWKTYRQLLFNKPEISMIAQLQQLVSDDMMTTLFPNLSKLASVSLSIPVTTASVERSFSQMKLIKTRLRSTLNDKNLSY